MDALLAVVLVCAAGVSADACNRDTSIDVMIGPARMPIDCLTGGQAAAAHSLTVPPDGTIKFTCERRKPS